MDDLDQGVARAARGRWAPGQSGNPGGKKPGTRNRASRLRELLDDGDVAAAIRVLRDKLAAGDGVAARFVLDRLFPKPRDREIDLSLPPPEAGTTVADLFDRVLWMMAAGEITIDEASRIVRLIQQRPAGAGRATAAAQAVSPASDLQTAGGTAAGAADRPLDRAPARPPGRPLNRHDRRRAAALLRAADPPGLRGAAAGR